MFGTVLPSVRLGFVLLMSGSVYLIFFNKGMIGIFCVCSLHIGFAATMTSLICGKIQTRHVSFVDRVISRTFLRPPAHALIFLFYMAKL